MSENFFQTQYDVTRKSGIRKFYESNKIKIISLISVLILLILSIIFYSEYKKKKHNLISGKYIEAQILIEKGKKDQAKEILKDIIYENNHTYSTLSFFLILNENLVTEKEKIIDMFNHLIEKNDFETEIKNLLLFKKAVFLSNYSDEEKLISTAKILINSETVWKPHALLLLGDFFYFKNEFLKASEFYEQILSIKGLNRGFYEQAKNQLNFTKNE